MRRSFSHSRRGKGAEKRRREELQRAERWYEIAIARTEKLLDEYDWMPSSEADPALVKALKFQEEMMDEYADTFRQLMLEGEPASKGVPAKRKPRERIQLKPLTRTAGSG
jgi:hypothetical protein